MVEAVIPSRSNELIHFNVDLFSPEQLVMKTTAIAVTLPQVRSRSCLTERLACFVSLIKPRVMLLAVFTAAVGLAIAPGHLDLLRGSLAIPAIATEFAKNVLYRGADFPLVWPQLLAVGVIGAVYFGMTLHRFRRVIFGS